MFNEKVVLVTGGTSGMGFVTARRFVKEGAFVFIAGRNIDKGKEAINDLKEISSDVKFIQTDVTDSKSVEQLIDDIMTEKGKIDCVFNNAGITAKVAMTADIDIDNWYQVINTNLNGTLLCMKFQLKAMLSQGYGAIVNNSSVAGVIAIPGQAAYVASKHAVCALTKACAIEYASKNIRINAIAPGPIIGGMNSEERLKADPERTKKKAAVTAMQRFGTPDEVAQTALWLCSDMASYITGTVIPVDGGTQAGKW